MSRITYTSTASCALPVGWKCTKCGQLNAKICTVSARASASKQGTFHSQATADQAASQAQAIAMTHAARIITDLDSNQYSPVFNTCTCRACFHQEPWATVKANGLWIGICLLITFLSGIIALISILIEAWATMAITLGIVAICLGLIFLSIKKAADNSRKMEPIFDGLKETEKPICTPDTESLRILMAGILAQGPEDIAEINKAISRM